MKKLKLYLDNCCFNRPFDNQSQLIVRLETEAKLFIQEGIKIGEFDLVWSCVLDDENDANPSPVLKQRIMQWKFLAVEDVDVSEEVLQYAKHFAGKGIKSMDALHLACAKSVSVDYFITTDFGILKKRLVEIKTLNPLDFVQIIKGGIEP